MQLELLSHATPREGGTVGVKVEVCAAVAVDIAVLVVVAACMDELDINVVAIEIPAIEDK